MLNIWLSKAEGFQQSENSSSSCSIRSFLTVICASVLPALPPANTETWNYNAKGEVTGASLVLTEVDPLNPPTAAQQAEIAKRNQGFDFDGIGNRNSSTSYENGTADVKNYTSNALNQYSAVGVAARTFDDDGNLTDDGTKQFVWDAENRLIEVKNTGGTVATYAYDYKSRRISKTTTSTVTSFVYDYWNPIAEYSNNTLSKNYVWGKDVSGSTQGAGGVGGLLSVDDGSATYFPTFDGNGNVSEYVDSTGVTVAHYEYDAFGQAVASGTKANDFSHQYSTKQLDSETSLHYYGYRYYSADTGGWLSRDPIKEDGGANLYGFIFNSPITWIDIFGSSPYSPWDNYGPLQPSNPNDDPMSQVEPWREALWEQQAEGRRQAKKDKQRQDDVDEIARLRGDDWLNLLPSCPCSIDATVNPAQLSNDFGNGWSQPEKASAAHPGGTWEVRWTHPKFGTRVPGQQCIYDDCGKLITGGGGAGTPDYRGFDPTKWKVDPANWGHSWYDVLPWATGGHEISIDPELSFDAGFHDLDLDFDWNFNYEHSIQSYLEIRPPNNGKNCDENVK